MSAPLTKHITQIKKKKDSERVSGKYVDHEKIHPFIAHTTPKDFKERVKEYLPKKDGKFLSSGLSDTENLKLFRQMKILKRTDKKDFQEKLDRLNYVRKTEGKKLISTELFDIALTGRFLQKNYEADTEDEKLDKKNKDAVFPEVKPKKESKFAKFSRNFSNALKSDEEEPEEEPEEEEEPKPKLKVGDIVWYLNGKGEREEKAVIKEINDDSVVVGFPHGGPMNVRKLRLSMNRLEKIEKPDVAPPAQKPKKTEFEIGDKVKWKSSNGWADFDKNYHGIVTGIYKDVIHVKTTKPNNGELILFDDKKIEEKKLHKIEKTDNSLPVQKPKKTEFEIGNYITYSDGSMRERAKILHIDKKQRKFDISIINGGKIMNDVEYRYIYPLVKKHYDRNGEEDTERYYGSD